MLAMLTAFFDDHADELLGRGDDDDAVDGQRLEHGQGHVTGTGRHIDEQKVNIFPDDISPKLFDRAAQNWAAPQNRIGRIFQQEVDGHHVDAAGGADWEQALFDGFGAGGVMPNAVGDRGAGDVGVQDAGLFAVAHSGDRQHGGNSALANAALAGDDSDNLF